MVFYCRCVTYRLLSGQVQAARQSVTMWYPGPSLMNLTGAKCIFSQLLHGGGGWGLCNKYLSCDLHIQRQGEEGLRREGIEGDSHSGAVVKRRPDGGKSFRMCCSHSAACWSVQTWHWACAWRAQDYALLTYNDQHTHRQRALLSINTSKMRGFMVLLATHRANQKKMSGSAR